MLLPSQGFRSASFDPAVSLQPHLTCQHIMKHVTLTAPSLPNCSYAATPINDAQCPRGLTVPKHMTSSRQDGFRTPPGEDYDFAGHQLYGEKIIGGRSNNSSRSKLPQIPNGVLGHHSATASSASLGERLLERLHWRERIRHYTWTYFTMTMATGGTANVLHTGRSPHLIVSVGATC